MDRYVYLPPDVTEKIRPIPGLSSLVKGMIDDGKFVLDMSVFSAPGDGPYRFCLAGIAMHLCDIDDRPLLYTMCLEAGRRIWAISEPDIEPPQFFYDDAGSYHAANELAYADLVRRIAELGASNVQV
jgi:hypothetical protein